MPRDKAILKEQLNELSKKELVDIVLKLAGKRHNYEFLLVNFLDKEGGEKTLFEEAKADIDRLCQKEYKGKSHQKQLAQKLIACIKRLNEFVSDTKDKKLEADLVLYLLGIQFAYPATVFGHKSYGYDYKVGLLLKKLITLVTKKMHPDYQMDYQEKINEYLTRLHRTSDHINTIFDLPQLIE